MSTIRSDPGPKGVPWWSPAMSSTSRPASVASRTSSAALRSCSRSTRTVRWSGPPSGGAASKRVVIVTLRVGRIVPGARQLGHQLAGLGIVAHPVEEQPAVIGAEVGGVGQHMVDDGHAARPEVRRQDAQRRRCDSGPSSSSRLLSAMKASPKRRPSDTVVRSASISSSDPAVRRRPAGRGAGPCVAAPARASWGSLSTTVTAWPGERQGDRQPTAAPGQLQDRAAGPLRHGEVQVQVARVVLEVEVVVAGEAGRRVVRRSRRVDRSATPVLLPRGLDEPRVGEQRPGGLGHERGRQERHLVGARRRRPRRGTPWSGRRHPRRRWRCRGGWPAGPG